MSLLHINTLRSGINKEIEKIRKEYIKANFKRLEYASIKAIDVIIDILEDSSCTNSVKLNASKTIIDYSLKAREQTEIIGRLDNIEKRANDEI